MIQWIRTRQLSVKKLSLWIDSVHAVHTIIGAKIRSSTSTGVLAFKLVQGDLPRSPVQLLYLVEYYLIQQLGLFKSVAWLFELATKSATLVTTVTHIRTPTCFRRHSDPERSV